MAIKITPILEKGLICLRDLKDTRFELDNLQELAMDNDQLRLIEDSIWCVSNAIENLEEFVKSQRNGK